MGTVQTELDAWRLEMRRNPSSKARFVLTVFRIGRALRGLGPIGVLLALPLRVFYRLVVEWVFAVELPWTIDVGPGLKLDHPFGIVIHPRAILGRNVTLKHNVTIGIRGSVSDKDGVPTIGDNVIIGAGANILGAVRVGSGALVGAGSVVLRDIPDGSTAVGLPARIIGAIGD